MSSENQKLKQQDSSTCLLEYLKSKIYPTPNADKDAEQTGILIYCWSEYKMIQTLWNTV